MVRVGGVLVLWLAVTVADTAHADSAARVYSFGIVPQHKAVDLAARWTPLLQHLSAKTGLRFEFRTARDISTFEQRLAQGEFDIAYMNPFHYTVFHRQPGYRAFAREKSPGLRGVLVVHADAPFRRLEDLNGQALAFPAPGAFAASLIPRAQLRAAGVRVNANFVVSHDSVYYGVANRLFAAGGGIPDTLDRLEPAVRSRLRVLWTSPAYTPHAIAAHPRVPTAVITALRDAMLAAARDPQGALLLAALGFEGLVAAADEEYDLIRQLTPSIRAEICSLPESAGGSHSLLCPTSFAGRDTLARAPAERASRHAAP